MEIDFRTFIVQLGQGTLVALGVQPDPESNQRHVNVLLAQHHIGVLEMLQAKTQGPLNADEQQLLQALIADLNEKLEEVSQSS